MEFYIEPEAFWRWFDRHEDSSLPPSDWPREATSKSNQALRSTSCDYTECNQAKRLKSDHKPRTIEQVTVGRTGKRYVIMYAKHRPGRKNKIWEGDGFLTLLGQVAHLCTVKGRLLEEPVHLDEVDYESVENLGELCIGNFDVQIVELEC